MSPNQFQFVGSRPYDFTDDHGKRITGVAYYGITAFDNPPTGTVGHCAGKIPLTASAIRDSENLRVGGIYDAVYNSKGRIISFTPAKAEGR